MAAVRAVFCRKRRPGNPAGKRIPRTRSKPLLDHPILQGVKRDGGKPAARVEQAEHHIKPG